MKKIMMIGFVLLFTVAMVACGPTAGDPLQPDPNDPGIGGDPIQPEPVQPDPVAPPPENDNDEGDMIGDMVVVYNGRIDSNSIEVEDNGEEMAIMLSEDVKEDFDELDLESGQEIAVLYSVTSMDQIIAEMIEPLE